MPVVWNIAMLFQSDPTETWQLDSVVFNFDGARQTERPNALALGFEMGEADMRPFFATTEEVLECSF